jgi:hypothetical protein
MFSKEAEIAFPSALGWKDPDWTELLACMRRRKVIPVIGEELPHFTLGWQATGVRWLARLSLARRISSMI